MVELEIPAGLTDLLQDFTVCVLRDRPDDLIAYGARYFNRRNGSRMDGDRGGHVEFGGVPSDEEDEDAPPKLDGRYARRKSVSAERYDPEAEEESGTMKVVHPKTDGQRARLADAVSAILLFRSLDPEQMQDVLDAMFEKVVAPMDHVITQGDDGDNFYVIESGQYDILVDIDGEPKCVGSYDGKGSFGELALMYNMPRAATIVATSPGMLWAMDRSTFRRIVLKSAFDKRRTYEALLEAVPVLTALDTNERMSVADALISQRYEHDEQIIRQGDAADCMYFVEDGEVVIRIKAEGSADEVEISRCGKGAYFGELALVTHKPRAASAYASGATKCAVLDVKAFERLLGPCMDIMKRNIDEYDVQLRDMFGSGTEISDLR